MVYSKKSFLAALAILGLLGFTISPAGGETVLLDFSSPQCGPCHQMRPLIQDLKAQGYPIREVDVTRETQLASQYQIHSVPCFVLVADGREIDRCVGTTSRAHLQQMFQRAGAVSSPASSVQPAMADPSRSVTNPRRGTAGIADQAALPSSNCAVSQAAPAPAAPVTQSPVPPGSEPCINASVRLRVDDPSGQSYGTGTIIGAQSGTAIILTCGHLFRESKGAGPVTVDLFRAAPTGSERVKTLQGEVLSYDLTQDVGLVRIRPPFRVCTVPVAPEDTVSLSGDPVLSVGCNHGQNPTAWESRVTSINRYDGPSNIEASRTPVEGRSGGGLFNAQNQLIGVCFAADEQGNEGLYLGLESIHAELRHHGITSMASPATTPAAPPANLVANPSPPRSTGTHPPGPAMAIASQTNAPRAPAPEPSAATASPQPSAFALQAPAAFNAKDRAAFQELARRAQGSEVTVIIRPNEPDKKSEILILDNASPAFVQHLVAAARTATEPHRLTSATIATGSVPGTHRARPTERAHRIEPGTSCQQGWYSVPR